MNTHLWNLLATLTYKPYIDQYVTVEHNRSLAKYLDSSASKLPQKA